MCVHTFVLEYYFLVFTLCVLQVVLLSGHLDSWDVGQGAMDDGGGAVISWEALSLIKDLGETRVDTVSETPHTHTHSTAYVSMCKNTVSQKRLYYHPKGTSSDCTLS